MLSDEKIITLVSQSVQINNQYRTPDNAKQAPFWIHEIEKNPFRCLIRHASGNTRGVWVTEANIIGVIRYLRDNNHYLSNPIEIGSNNDIAEAGPLCRISRRQNLRNINYLLPILQKCNIVTTNGARPNTVWLNDGY